MSIHLEFNSNSEHERNLSNKNQQDDSSLELQENESIDASQENFFESLGVMESLRKVLTERGYVQPSPIQNKCIPLLLDGKDLLGMAETGSGKTAAFCLPGLQRLKLDKPVPQMLVLAPTRELALQVSQACEAYASHMKGLSVATIYGGQSYDLQKRALKKGAQVVVATPGRLLDFIKSKMINLSQISFVVLDEADEILRMGFIEAINEILEVLPKERQTALFSATMPDVIRRITHQYMNDPTEVRIQSKQRTAKSISQRYCLVNSLKKLKVLERFLETENFESAIIFVKTKGATSEVASFLERLGYACAALNGDMTQSSREQTLGRLRANKINILVATDVAARGLDIEHLGLVVNYDFPGESESYVHRIGRTGRAGRSGMALLFVESGQERGLNRLEKMLGTKIEKVEIPSAEKVKETRFEKLATALSSQNDVEEQQSFYSTIITSLKERLGIDGENLALKLLLAMQKVSPLLVKEDSTLSARPARQGFDSTRGSFGSGRFGGSNTGGRFRSERGERSSEGAQGSRSNRRSEKMKVYRLDIGRQSGLQTKHLVGALINEGRLSSHSIGNIKLFPRHSQIEISEEISSDKIRGLARIRIFNLPIALTTVQS